MLDVRGLKVSFFTSVGVVQAVRGIDIRLKPNTSLGIVGESGCGKSVTSLAIMGLIPFPGRVVDGEIMFHDEANPGAASDDPEQSNLLKKEKKEMRRIRGNRISMIFQDPMTSLNPVYTIGNQVGEIIKEHNPNMSKSDVTERSVELLGLVGIPSPVERLKQYPHEFSGGMRQRAMIAIALANNPALLIADEPTTALDVTIQAQILELMKDLRSTFKTSIILITHDLGVVADVCEEIKVMYAGLVAEEGTARDIFYAPAHPYTWGLLKSIPKIVSGERSRLSPIAGQPPDLIKPPVGCAFAGRCPHAMRICKEIQPPFFHLNEHHRSTCWLLHEEASERLAEAREGTGL